MSSLENVKEVNPAAATDTNVGARALGGPDSLKIVQRISELLGSQKADVPPLVLEHPSCPPNGAGGSQERPSMPKLIFPNQKPGWLGHQHQNLE